MASQRTTGVVIKVADYGESDKIVTLYCPDEGRLSVIAKGAKRSKKRFMNKLEIFTHLDLFYNDRYRLPLIEQADMRDCFANMRTNYRRYAAASLVCELLLYWSRENDGDPLIFQALLQTFAVLNNLQESHGKALVLFLIHLYTRLGYQPALSACAKCGALEAAAAPFYFQAGSGAIICSRCGTAPQHSISLPIATIKLIDQAQKLPFAKTARLQFQPDAVRQVMHLYQQYSSYLLDRQINSWAFLR